MNNAPLDIEIKGILNKVTQRIFLITLRRSNFLFNLAALGDNGFEACCNLCKR